MRILQVTTMYYPEMKFGGPPLKIHSLSRGLIGLGHSVQVMTLDSENRRRADDSCVEGVPVKYLPWHGWGTRQFPLHRHQLAGLVASADWVHCYGLYNLLCPTAARLARTHRRPCLVEPLGMYRPRARNRTIKGLYHRLFTHRMLAGAVRVVANSPAEMDDLQGIVPREKLVLRRNGINVADYHHLPPATVFRERFKLAPGDKVILFIGRLSPIKNLEALVQAFHVAGLLEHQLFLVGPQEEPEYTAALQRQIESLGLAHRVHLPGILLGHDKLAALAAADFFVMPSHYESFGNAAAEAVAAGVPVLLTKQCGIAAVVDGRAGLAVDTDVLSLASGLQTMADPMARARMTAKRAEVLNELSWDAPLRQMDELYRSLAQQPKTRN